MRDSPVLRHHDAWIGEKSSPRTPDSGLALSLADSKHSAGWAISDSQSGSTKESYSAGSNEDVFDESVSQSKRYG